jgi:hypothetical protein
MKYLWEWVAVRYMFLSREACRHSDLQFWTSESVVFHASLADMSVYWDYQSPDCNE